MQYCQNKKSSNDLNYQYYRFNDGYYIKNDPSDYNLSSLYDNSGKVLINRVNSIQRIIRNYFAASKNTQSNNVIDDSNTPKAIFDNKGNKLSDYIYYNINELENGTIAVCSNNQTYLIDGNLKEINGFKKLQGYWTLSVSGNLIKAVFNNNLRYFTKQGVLVFQSDATYSFANGAKLTCELYKLNGRLFI